MCWSEEASLAMAGLGVAAALVTLRRGEKTAIPVALTYFAGMEALQLAGYQVLDQCSSSVNQTVTLLSYLHIAFQPLFINAFVMAIAPVPVSDVMRRRVYMLSALSTVLLLVRLVPLDALGPCQNGQVLCGMQFCTVSGNWHLGWQVPLNDLWGPVFGPASGYLQFPSYVFAAFVLPIFYGAWRFALFHLCVGPVLAMLLTDNPLEMPAIWCLFSVGIILAGISPMFRQRLLGARAA